MRSKLLFHVTQDIALAQSYSLFLITDPNLSYQKLTEVSGFIPKIDVEKWSFEQILFQFAHPNCFRNDEQKPVYFADKPFNQEILNQLGQQGYFPLFGKSNKAPSRIEIGDYRFVIDDLTTADNAELYFLSLDLLDLKSKLFWEKEQNRHLRQFLTINKTESKKEIAYFKKEVENYQRWYQSIYGHLPKWYVYIGKVFKLFLSEKH